MDEYEKMWKDLKRVIEAQVQVYNGMKDKENSYSKGLRHAHTWILWYMQDSEKEDELGEDFYKTVSGSGG